MNDEEKKASDEALAYVRSHKKELISKYIGSATGVNYTVQLPIAWKYVKIIT
ncbi:MAG TPA: hypothetical protein VF974_00370 [Patescibacteria group bacterium]